MTSTAPFVAFLGSTIRRWLTAKGFAIVLIAALFPALFVGAWAGTHRDDIGVTDLSVPDDMQEGQAVNFTATFTNLGSSSVGAFNATVGIFQDPRFPLERETQTIEGLAPGESRTVTLTWNAQPGAFVVAALADVGEGAGSGDIGERDENNNIVPRVIEIPYAAPTTEATRPGGLQGEESATTLVDLVVDGLSWSPEAPTTSETQINLTATVRNTGTERIDNATANLRVSRIVSGRTVTVTEQPTPITLEPGESRELRLTWTWQPGSFWAEAYAAPAPGTSDPNADNYVSRALTLNQIVDPTVRDEIERPEEATFKTYYRDVIIGFYLSLVIPLIALFYAAGVLSDERDAGTLPYILTRPIPRWLIPISKWLAGFVVIALAATIGLVVSFALMFGTGAGASSAYLAAPLVLTILAIACYLAVFVLLGIWSERPYILGLLFVLAWETIAARLVVDTGAGTQPLLPWVGNLTILQHLNNALAGWELDAGLRWLPEGADATRALLVLLAILVVGLAVASSWIRKRDFAVG